jgi:hypothetical protein
MSDTLGCEERKDRIHSLKKLKNRCFERSKGHIYSYFDFKMNSLNLKQNKTKNKSLIQGLKGLGFNL